MRIDKRGSQSDMRSKARAQYGTAVRTAMVSCRSTPLTNSSRTDASRPAAGSCPHGRTPPCGSGPAASTAGRASTGGGGAAARAARSRSASDGTSCCCCAGDAAGGVDAAVPAPRGAGPSTRPAVAARAVGSARGGGGVCGSWGAGRRRSSGVCQLHHASTNFARARVRCAAARFNSRCCCVPSRRATSCPAETQTPHRCVCQLSGCRPEMREPGEGGGGWEEDVEGGKKKVWGGGGDDLVAGGGEPVAPVPGRPGPQPPKRNRLQQRPPSVAGQAKDGPFEGHAWRVRPRTGRLV